MSDDQNQMLHEKHNSYKEQKSEKELPRGMSRVSKPKIKNKWTNTGKKTLYLIPVVYFQKTPHKNQKRMFIYIL